MDDFYAARSGTIPPLPWPNFAPPLIGQGVTERDSNGKAAAEVRELLKWLMNKMEGKTDDKKARVA